MTHVQFSLVFALSFLALKIFTVPGFVMLLVVSRCKMCSKTQTQVVVPLHIAFFLSFFPSVFFFFFFFFFCFLFLFYSFLFGWSQQSCIFLGCCLDHCVWHWPLWLQKLGRKKSQWLALLVPYQNRDMQVTVVPDASNVANDGGHHEQNAVTYQHHHCCHHEQLIIITLLLLFTSSYLHSFY